MADEEFEIDLYDDANNEQAEQTEHKGEDSDSHTYNHDDGHAHGGQDANGDYADEQYQDDMDQQEHDSTDQYPPQQGTKRKEAHDDRPVDPGATTAILISELNWWNTDDEIRGWARQAGCESELRDITFSEHKVNGKCKGQAYVEFTSPQGATALKHQIDMVANESSQPGQKKQSAIYSTPTTNPFRTLPKDAPNRAGSKDLQQNRTPSGGSSFTGGGGGGGAHNNYGNNGNFNAVGPGGYNRGGRGGFNRGGGVGMGVGGGAYNNRFNNNNAFSNNNNMGMNNPMGGGNFGGGGFGGNFGGGGGFGGRGNMMGGMRGAGMRGRGGNMGGGMLGGMGVMGGPMGGMGMGGMGGPMGGPMAGAMGMGMMGGGMPGFQGMNPQFNPAFFNGGNQSNDWGQNPHGVKRQRGE